MTDTMTKNGFTAIPNQLLEAIYSHSFTVTEMKIVLAVIRYTYGYRREASELSISFIANATDVHKSLVARCIRQLTDKGVLRIHKAATNNEPKQLGIQTDTNAWDKGMDSAVHSDTEPTVHSGMDSTVHSGVNSAVYTGMDSAVHQEIYSKEIYKEKDKYIALGVYKNVYMTEEEYKELRRCYRVCDLYIDKLSEYMLNKKKNYADHRATVIEWMEKDGIIMNRSTFDVDEFFLAAVADSKRKIQNR